MLTLGGKRKGHLFGEGVAHMRGCREPVGTGADDGDVAVVARPNGIDGNIHEGFSAPDPAGGMRNLAGLYYQFANGRE
jgi:hypothetical protein